jgi:hypothetical protein
MPAKKKKKTSKPRLKSVIKTPEIEFLCLEEDVGVIPEPYPARKLMPDWFKHLPPKINQENKLENSTIKRCAPFLDAMTVGWIIPLAADVEFITNDDASNVTYKSLFYRTMVENHGVQQIGTEKAPHPHSPKPPMKFLNYWAMRVPPGWSILFVPPLNRQDFRFECISGLVDADGYFEFINFPFIFKEPRYTGIIKQGTPLVQAIPIKRDALISDYKVRKFEQKDIEDLELTRRKRKAHESLYRDHIWEPK